MHMSLVLILGVVALLLVFAALHDVFDRTIPNWVSVAIAVLFLPAAYFANLSIENFGWHLLVGFVALLIGVGLFYLKVWGGGDAKLVAATSLWMGIPAEMTFLAAFAIAGGLVALPLIIVRRLDLKFSNPRMAKVFDTKKVPYGVAITAGAFWAATQSPVFIIALNAISQSQS